MFLSDKFICFLKENFKAWTQYETRLSELRRGPLTLDKDGCASILRMAAYKDRLDILKELFSYTDSIKLDRQYFINLKDKQGNTAILIAASMGHTTVFSYLLEMKACIYRPNQKSYTPLSIAYKKGHKQILESFFQSNIPLSYYNEFGYSILETALNNQEIEFAQFLVANAKGLDIHLPLKCPEKGYWHFNKVPFHTENLTPLVRAIKARNFELAINLILKLGANVNIPFGHGETPFRILITLIHQTPDYREDFREYINLLRLVLDHSKYFIFLESTETIEGDFMFALKQMLLEELKTRPMNFQLLFPLILSKSPNINAVDKKEKMTPLELALKFGSKKYVHGLLKNGADLHCVFDKIPGFFESVLQDYRSNCQQADKKFEEERYRQWDPEIEDPWTRCNNRIEDLGKSLDQSLERFERILPKLVKKVTKELQDIFNKITPLTLDKKTPLHQPLSNIIITYAYTINQETYEPRLTHYKNEFKKKFLFLKCP